MAALIAAVLTLLAAPVAEAVALAPSESPATYVYDSHRHPALVTWSVTERGPPARHDGTTTYDDGLRSLGGLARPNGPTTFAAHDYNVLGALAQIARGCKLAEERADGAPEAALAWRLTPIDADAALDLLWPFAEPHGVLGSTLSP